MKKISYIPFIPFFRSHYFSDHPERDSFFFRERFGFNRLTILKGCLLVAFILGFFHRDAWVFFFTESLLLFFLFKRTKQLAETVEVTRAAPIRAVEQERIGFNITLKNWGNFSLRDCVVRDCFTGCTQSLFSEYIDTPIAPKSEHTIEFKTSCNGGMGRHHFGPLQVFIRDPFGLFNYIVSFDTKNPIDVYPKVFEIPPLGIKKGAISLNYGNLISQTKGLSTNLQGVREYRPRDSFRHISWRLSAKRNQLLVKEFDQMVNANIVLALDLDLSHHTGHKADSSLEYAKDLANSIICQQIQEGNSVQLLTNTFYSDSRRGESHQNELLALISKTREAVDPDPRSIEERYFGLIQENATLIHVGPVFLKHSQQFIELLTRLRAQGTEVILYLIDPLSFLEHRPEMTDSHLQRALHTLSDEFSYLEKLAFKGFDFRMLRRNKDVASALLESSL